MLKFLTSLFKPEPVKPAPATSDTSMLFAVEEIVPFLTRLANNPRFGLPGGLAASVAAGLPDLAEQQSRRWRIDGGFDTLPAHFEIEVMMERGGEADVTFSAPQPAVEEINRELAAFDAAAER
ncbi:hypothetical protein K3552_02405 [Leisingera aquaemixtae]|uniref:hypothetical protein n=1 Tax=Leisingera aquaemixtae TaxID=1396826 RepID=UPI0021A46A65|nr:hypothetical protein [Leisingera aquaemixtae]UWQ37882.1 hypothetical protein K3552_02405 [Leisingera aquaemixtae]